MKETQTSKNKYPDSEGKGHTRLDAKDLIRKGIHSQQKENQNSLYPSNDSAEDSENLSKNCDEDSLNSSDNSPEKSELNQRSRGKKKQLSKLNQPSSKTNKDKLLTIQNYLIWIFIAVVISILVLYLFWSHSHKPSETGINIENLMIDIKKEYNTQSDLTFRIVKSAIKTAVLTDSTPGILILLSSTEAKDVSEQFAIHIANALSKSFVFIKYDLLKKPEELKRDIDVEIQSNLSDNELKAVVVNQLDHLPFEAAMMFHSYCDHENAPFKKALYIMTVSSNERIPPSSDSKTLDSLASDRLKSVWEKSGMDQVSSLISRLTGSVAGVTA